MTQKGHSLQTKTCNKKIEKLALNLTFNEQFCNSNSSKLAVTETITFFKTRYVKQKT